MRIVFALFAYSLALFAQATVSSDPLVVKNPQILNHPLGSQVAFEITNNGAKPISAYAVVIEVMKDGKKVRTFTELGIATKNKAFNPGVTKLRKGFGLGPGPTPEYKVIVDYVKFTDGTSWGPNTYRSSGRIEDFLQGYHSKRDEEEVVLRR